MARNITNTNPKVKLQVIQDQSQTPLKIWYGNHAELPAELDDNTLYLVRDNIDASNIAG